MLSSTLYSALPIPFMKGVNMANDSAMRLSRLKLVPEDSQAMQCDLCHRWAHIECVGVTKAA